MPDAMDLPRNQPKQSVVRRAAIYDLWRKFSSTTNDLPAVDMLLERRFISVISGPRRHSWVPSGSFMEVPREVPIATGFRDACRFEPRQWLGRILPSDQVSLAIFFDSLRLTHLLLIAEPKRRFGDLLRTCYCQQFETSWYVPVRARPLLQR